MTKAPDYRWPEDAAAWSRLRGFGNSHLAKATMLLPVYGYFIIFNDRIGEYLRLHSEFCAAGGCDPGWRTYCIFFGAAIAAVSSIVFTWKCPSIIKRYPTSREFFRNDHMFYTHPNHFNWMLDDIAAMDGTPYRDGLMDASVLTMQGALNLQHAHTLSGPMAAFFNLRDHKHWFWRHVTLYTYRLAAIFLAVPTLFTVYQVIRIIFVKLAGY